MVFVVKVDWVYVLYDIVVFWLYWLKDYVMMFVVVFGIIISFYLFVW